MHKNFWEILQTNNIKELKIPEISVWILVLLIKFSLTNNENSIKKEA
jgi:hypothetical protein